jgi:hypothetical protein
VSPRLPAVVTYFHATLCSVLWRDSTALLSLAPCCALSPACVAAVPAFGRLQCSAPPLGSLFSVQLCSGTGLGCVYVCYHGCAVRAALWRLLCVYFVSLLSRAALYSKTSALSLPLGGGESRSQLRASILSCWLRQWMEWLWLTAVRQCCV